MKHLLHLLIVIAAFGFSACDTTEFTSTWHDPAISEVDWRGSVAVFLLSGNEPVRRSFEDHLASELNERGIEASPGYELLPESKPTDKKAILNSLKRTGTDYAIFMRVTDRKEEVSYVPGSSWYGNRYDDPYYWYGGRYYGPAGFGRPWPPYHDSGYFQVDTVVSVETLLYSFPDSKLLFAGLSRTMNPSEIDNFVDDLADETLDELKKLGAETTS